MEYAWHAPSRAARVTLCVLAKVCGGGSYVRMEDVTVALGDAENQTQYGLGSAFNVLALSLLCLWAEDNTLHLKPQNLSKTTVGKRGGITE